MSHSPAIIVHGGAGHWNTTDFSLAQQHCQHIAQQIWTRLHNGGSALDAVTHAVILLEDDPLFNAGTGSVLNVNGDIEMDAAIMDGSTLAAGSVCGIRQYKNPIQIARTLLQEGSTVMLCGEGAEHFARARGIASCDPVSLHVTRREQQWQQKHGTVGAVAIDLNARLAAATSTGGLFDKPLGRISDSALIGCGTYANHFAAISCTGIGEAIIRTVLAKSVADRIEHGMQAMVAANASLDMFVQHTQSEAGLIVIDHLGHIGIAYNTINMPHYWITESGEGPA